MYIVRIAFLNPDTARNPSRTVDAFSDRAVTIAIDILLYTSNRFKVSFIGHFTIFQAAKNPHDWTEAWCAEQVCVYHLHSLPLIYVRPKLKIGSGPFLISFVSPLLPLSHIKVGQLCGHPGKYSATNRRDIAGMLTPRQVAASSSVSGTQSPSSSSVAGLDLLPSKPLKRKRGEQDCEQEKPIPPDSDVVFGDQEHSLDKQSMQTASCLLAQDRCLNDDCVNTVLKVFNPDPSIWLVLSSHTAAEGPQSSTHLSKIKNAVSLARKVMMPVFLPTVSHWVLAIYDRSTCRFLLYDPLGSRQGVRLAFETFHSVLKKLGVSDGHSSIETQFFPSMRQADDGNCGIFLIAAALSLFHSTPIKFLTPDLWRNCLASLFCMHGRLVPQGVSDRIAEIIRVLAVDASQGAPIETQIERVEAMSAATPSAKAYAEEMTFLLQLTDTQIQFLEKQERDREVILKLDAWFSQHSSLSNYFSAGMENGRQKSHYSRLQNMPGAMKNWIQQLRLLSKHCSIVNNKFLNLTSDLEQKTHHTRVKVMEAYIELGTRVEKL